MVISTLLYPVSLSTGIIADIQILIVGYLLGGQVMVIITHQEHLNCDPELRIDCVFCVMNLFDIPDNKINIAVIGQLVLP